MQIRSGGLGESRISVKPIARSVVVLHRDVHLRLCWNDNRPSGDHPENGKEKFHPMLYRDLSVNTDAALQEVALKISALRDQTHRELAYRPFQLQGGSVRGP